MALIFVHTPNNKKRVNSLHIDLTSHAHNTHGNTDAEKVFSQIKNIRKRASSTGQLNNETHLTAHCIQIMGFSHFHDERIFVMRNVCARVRQCGLNSCAHVDDDQRNNGPKGIYLYIYMRSAHAQCAVVWCTKPSSSVGCKQTHARP